MIGCKLLQSDNRPLVFPYSDIFRAWPQYQIGHSYTTPGEGCYVATIDGIDREGFGPILAYFECWGAHRVGGHIRGFRWVRRIPDCPDKLPGELLYNIASKATSLPLNQRLELIRLSTPYLIGQFTRACEALSGQQIFELGVLANPRERGLVAFELKDKLTNEQRLLLIEGSLPYQKGQFAHSAIWLDTDKRIDLAMQSTPEERGAMANFADNLTTNQRILLLSHSTQWWRNHFFKRTYTKYPDAEIAC